MGILDGRVVVVTGAGRGIGREHALLLASLGAQVVVNDLGGGTDGSGSDRGPARQVVDEAIALGYTAVESTDDVAEPEGAQHLIDLAVDTFGDLHGLVNNAGILRDRTLASMDDDDWDTSIRVNLRGVFAPTRAAARYWKDRSKAGAAVSASVVNTSSESGIFANAGQSNYAAAKAGVAALTEVWHKELGRYGVRVNAIVPRARTRLTESLVRGPRPDVFDKWDPANVSPFVAYLLSERCAISGQLFLVYGGLIQRAAPWTLDPDWRVESDSRWDMDELVAAMESAPVPTNGERDTGTVR
ncbi:MAG TPA: SDR family NAD(P)-dependent oxidoreductase [Acidimicrobiales bacterium]|jgi:NAD(P)-dependent dehydrogenase (short-subunit alcohol dehydrogenase family)|nr:SDR family NAD(P)-dependent oxidoreductase [Acidimicrobiales bacterium]